MNRRAWERLLAVAITCGVLGAGAAADAAQRGRGRPSDIPQTGPGIASRPRPLTPAGGRALGVPAAQRGPRTSAEPAFAAGYDGGHERGSADGREGGRYDPVRHREYRDADAGYTDSYGSKDAYRTNYRAGFRQGYEDGYRAGTRHRH